MPNNTVELEVTAQQSRFHADAFDTPTSKEIDVKDISITIGDRELLAHADLKLRENVHYVLVGRNGTGKSTLLRALAEGRIPGVPWSLRILLLGQSSLAVDGLEGLVAGMQIKESSVLEHVVRSDARRELALKEVDRLTNALDNVSDALAVVRTARSLKHERLLRKLAEMKEIASRRSGARGNKARKELISLETQVAASTSLLGQSDSDIDASAVQNETRFAVDTLAELTSYLETIDSQNAEAKARSILLGLGFALNWIDRPFSTLSGGWRTRCNLACALFQNVDILLLDECTNFLDLPAVIWLQNYIQNLDSTTVVMITHDRDFADVVADELLVLREGKLEHFCGNLSAFEDDRRSQRKYLTRMKESQDRKTKHMEETIEGNVRAARRTGDDKKLKQAASRRKKLDERMGMEVGLRGGKFKLNRDLAGFHLNKRSEIKIPTVDPAIHISIPTTPTALRYPGALLSMKQISFSYPGSTQPTLRNIDLVIHLGERVGIVGLNGAGKSTLVRLVHGTEHDPGGGESGLRPTSGTVTHHSRARILCFSQHAVEELEAKGMRDGNITALSELLSTSSGSLTEQDARALLGSLGLPGRLASDVPIAALSGGQKVRLALAKLTYSPPHLLVLDEVTTHLDADTILALVEVLKRYEGALLVITHDRFFMRCVVEGDSPHEFGDDSDGSEEAGEEEERKGSWKPKPGVVYRLVKGEMKVLDGGMRKYESIVSKKMRKYH